ncbi:MAG: flagellar biosynthetic protein FliO [Candidatus Krumholzibacteriia bacterium]
MPGPLSAVLAVVGAAPAAVDHPAAALLDTAGGGWWRAMAGMAVVFGLLVICLRLLRRWPGARGSGAARVEAIWPLGPRREIHVVRLGDEIHYVYRNEQGLALLRREPWEAYRAARPVETGPTGRPVAGARSLLASWLRRASEFRAAAAASSPRRSV